MTQDQWQQEFDLEGWRVQPSLNRLTRAGNTVQIEPKFMDVLVYLASRSGEVVSKNEITDAVWPDVFISESVITRAIAGLRRAFGDDAREPRFIETISKRGYRLLAKRTHQTGAPVAVTNPEPPATRHAAPYVVGQWVRGYRFYGRRELLSEVLDGNRNWLWLLGTRRIGKTSVLKQLEHTTNTRPELGYVPVFWDLQGAESAEDLHLDFHDALLDAEERLAVCGVAVAEVADDDLFAALGRLRRALAASKRTLLLLCDEVEELIHLNKTSPGMLRKLRRAMQSREGIRSVLASSGRLWSLADQAEDTSPFLDGFIPPLYVGTVGHDEAVALIRQEQLAPETRPGFDDATVDEIALRCGNHPYLMQMLAKRCLHVGDLEEATAQIAADRTVAHFFTADMNVLATGERQLLQAVATGADPADVDDQMGSAAHALLRLGLLRSKPDGGYDVPNRFLQDWLLREYGESVKGEE